MQSIEFAVTVQFGDKTIDEIEVAPLTFVEMAKLWKKASQSKSKPEVALQRARIVHQTHFKAAGERIMPDEAQLNKLHASVAKSIISKLDIGQGRPGKVLNDGDGALTSILYQLGTPIGMKNSKGEDVSIKELEFQAETYGELEDVLASDNEISRTVELLKRIAKPVGDTALQMLPGWALDRITTADGVTIMTKILPSF